MYIGRPVIRELRNRRSNTIEIIGKIEKPFGMDFVSDDGRSTTGDKSQRRRTFTSNLTAADVAKSNSSHKVCNSSWPEFVMYILQKEEEGKRHVVELRW